MNRACLLLATVLLVGAPGLAHAGGHSNTRDGWVYGMNMGWGWAQARATDTFDDSSIESRWIDDITGGLRVAFAPDDTWTYGLDLSGWTEPAEGLDETIYWILAQFRYFPGGEGLFVHAGAGLGALNLTYVAPQGTVTQTNGGLAWGVGAGYEYRVTPTLAVGLSYDYRHVSVGEISYLDDVATSIHGATLTATWYMN